MIQMTRVNAHATLSLMSPKKKKKVCNHAVITMIYYRGADSKSKARQSGHI
jgi:hypothetical protein